MKENLFKKYVILIFVLTVLISGALFLRVFRSNSSNGVSNLNSNQYHNMSAAPYAVYKALEVARISSEIVTSNEKQNDYFITTLGVKDYEKYKSGEKLSTFKGMDFNLFSKKELMGFWIDDNEKLELVRKILIDRGFGSSFAKKVTLKSAVSILKVLMQWKKAGRKTKLFDKERKGFDAVLMQSQKHHFNVYRIEDKYEIIELETKNDDKVYIAMVEEIPLDNISIIRQVKQLKNKKWNKEDVYDQICFPMVDFKNESDISYFKGLFVGETVDAAYLKVLFKMNQIGARVDAAAVFSFKCAAVRKKELTIDRPFILWIERPGLSLPIVAIYCDKNYWKDPGEIDFN